MAPSADDLNTTDRLILAKLREGRATPGYLADELGKQQSYISQRLAHLTDLGVVAKAARGLYGLDALEGETVDARAIAEDASAEELVAPDLGADAVDTGPRDTDRDVEPPGGGRPEPVSTDPDRTDSDDISRELKQVVETMDLPGSGSTLEERRRAVWLAYEYIRDKRTVQVQELKDYIWAATETGYDSTRSLWANCVYDALQELADRDDDLEPPGAGGQVWRYHGAEPSSSIYDPTEEF